MVHKLYVHLQHKTITTMIQSVKTNNRRGYNKSTIQEVPNSNPINKESFKSKKVAPEGYMTSEEFWKISRESIDNICRKHGLL